MPGAGAGGEGSEEVVFNGDRVSVADDEEGLNVVVMVAQQRECT